jgi:nitrogen fixation protein FixH
MASTHTTQTSSTSATRPGGILLWLLLGIAAGFVTINAVMLVYALHSPPVLVSVSYYEDSRRYGAVQAAEEAMGAAGWRVEVQPAPPAAVIVRLADRAGKPASGFTGQAQAYRPNDAALDQALAWSEEPDTPGSYRAQFARPRAGQWRIRLALRRGGERIDHEFRIVTP